MPTVRQLWKPVLVLAASFMLFVLALVLPFAQVGISAAPPSAALIPASASLARSSGPQARLGADIPFSPYAFDCGPDWLVVPSPNVAAFRGIAAVSNTDVWGVSCLLYTSPSPRD